VWPEIDEEVTEQQQQAPEVVGFQTARSFGLIGSVTMRAKTAKVENP